jgi:hypothetical protein
VAPPDSGVGCWSFGVPLIGRIMKADVAERRIGESGMIRAMGVVGKHGRAGKVGTRWGGETMRLSGKCRL